MADDDAQPQRQEQHGDLRNVNDASARSRPPLLNPSSTDTSLTRAANNLDEHDHAQDEKNVATNQRDDPAHEASSSTNDDDENPDADVDPHLANGHGKGGYGEHHERQKSENGQDEEEDVIIVDWDGPDDPCNPRKCVLKFCSFFAVR